LQYCSIFLAFVRQREYPDLLSQIHSMKNLCQFPFLFAAFICVYSISSCSGSEGSQNQEKAKGEGNEKMRSANHVQKPYSVFCDQAGEVWVGTREGEIHHYSSEGKEVLKAKDGFQGKNVMAINQLANGMHVFGSEKGLNLYDGFNFQTIALPFSDTSSSWLDKVYPIINPNEVHALLPLESGELWIGTGGAGAYLWDGLKFQSHLEDGGQLMPDGLHHNWISNLDQDLEGNIWFCSMSKGGLAKYDGEQFVFLTEDAGLHSDMVRKVLCDQSGRIFITYKPKYGAGLSILDGDELTTYSEKDGLNMLSIMGICEDQNGRVWMGGDLDEVHYLENGEFHLFRDAKGNTLTGVVNMEVDHQGRVWMAGKGGLWRWDGESLQRL
jgi:ligand-binding sensor domain-containing protein